MNSSRGVSLGSSRQGGWRCTSTAIIALTCGLVASRAPAVTLLTSASPDGRSVTGAAAPLLSAAVRAGDNPGAVVTESPAAARVRASAWQLPLAFESADEGAPGGAQYAARGPGYQVFLGRGGAVVALRVADTVSGSGVAAPGVRSPRGVGAEASAGSFQLLRLRFEGAATDGPSATAEAPLSGRIHRLIGSDPARWQRDLRAFGRVRYADLYPGVDVVFYGNGRELEYDLVVAPGASPDAARLRFDGVKTAVVDADGQLRLDTGKAVLVQRRPVAYQDGPRGRVRVEASYRQNADGTVGFALGEFDARRPLVIDPILSYATLVGGLGFDQCWDIAVDAAGAAFVTGESESASFTNVHLVSTNAFLTTLQGGVANVAGDAFVGKLAPDGTAFEWLTYLGGRDLDAALSIALTAGGEPVVGGFTTSTNFPVSTNAWLRTLPGTTNRFTLRKPLCGFVARLTADGSGLQASTLYGAEGEDQVLDVAVLPDGSIAAVGSTTSTNLPVTAGAPQPVYGGATDGFLARFSADGTTLLLSTYVGGSGRDSAEGLAVDAAAGLIHVVGISQSTNLPVKSALQSTNAGGADVLVAGYRVADGSMTYGTYLGGESSDYAYRAAVDAAGAVWVVGETFSQLFPVQGGVQATNAGGGDAFAVRLSSDGQAFQYGTFLGGLFEDAFWDVAVDGGGAVHFGGMAYSLAVTGVSTNTSLQGTNAGAADALVARLATDGTLTATFYGGLGDDIGYGIATDPAGNVYVAGRARSVDFPVSSTNVAQATFGGGRADGFVLKLSEAPSLAAIRSADGLELSWAAPNPAYVLESAASASPLAEWRVDAAKPELKSGRHVVRLPVTAADRVFRLRSRR